jgi:uncharacterized membrane protein
MYKFVIRVLLVIYILITAITMILMNDFGTTNHAIGVVLIAIGRVVANQE